MALVKKARGGNYSTASANRRQALEAKPTDAYRFPTGETWQQPSSVAPPSQLILEEVWGNVGAETLAIACHHPAVTRS
jgi:hypothetical protein